MGRKNKYLTHVQPRLEEIKEWYGILTEAQIAKRLNVTQQSFDRYKNKYPELKEALRLGRKELVVDLKNTLKKKARGFHYEETKTTIKDDGTGPPVKVIEKYSKYAAPDTGAIHLLLKNLDDDWRNEDKQTMDLKQAKLELEQKKAEEESW